MKQRTYKVEKAADSYQVIREEDGAANVVFINGSREEANRVATDLVTADRDAGIDAQVYQALD